MIGDRLASLRRNHDWTQQGVADRLGISRGTYAHYEINKRTPDPESLAKLAELFEVSIDYLVTGKQPDPQGVDSEQAEFLRWVEESLEGSFYYDFKKAPEESKREMMETLKFIWEREKRRQPWQKQGE